MTESVVPELWPGTVADNRACFFLSSEPIERLDGDVFTGPPLIL